MANLNSGRPIGANTTVTSQTLHDLIENATLSNLSGGDISGGGIFFVQAQQSTPNPSIASPFWFKTDPEDPIFRVYAAPFGTWLAVGPDRFEFALRNGSGTDALKGCFVVASTAPSEFTIASGVTINGIGFTQDLIPAGAYGPVACCGIGYALYSSASSGSNDRYQNQDVLINRNCPPGTMAGLNIDGNDGSGPMYGVWLESSRSGASGINTPRRALLWSPKLTLGF